MPAYKYKRDIREVLSEIIHTIPDNFEKKYLITEKLNKIHADEFYDDTNNPGCYITHGECAYRCLNNYVWKGTPLNYQDWRKTIYEIFVNH